MAQALKDKPAQWLRNIKDRKAPGQPAKDQSEPLFDNPFSIEDLAVFDDVTMQSILNKGAFGVSKEDLALSLHGLPTHKIKNITRKLLPDQRTAVKEKIQRPAALTEIEAARKRVLDGLFWELTYWKTPELYEELTEGERLHPGIYQTLGSDLRGRIVADVGAGSGRATFEALRQGVERVYAIEPSPGLLHILNNKLAGKPVAARIIPVQGRFEALPLQDDSVDVTLSCSAFTADPGQGGQAGLDEMRRITRSHGKIVIIWPRPEDHEWLAGRGFQYVALPEHQEMKVNYRSLDSALKVAHIFYARNKKVARFLRRHRRPEVPFSVLGFNPPRDFCWLEVIK